MCVPPICKFISVYTVGLLYSVPWNISKRGNTVVGSADEKKSKNIWQKKKTLLLSVTPHTFSSVCWGAVRLLNLHHSKGQSMEEGPFVRNCQRRQGPQAWSPRVKSAYLGCHLDMTGPQGQGRRVKLLTTLNVTPALLYYERHAKWLTSSTATKVRWYITCPYSTPTPPRKKYAFISSLQLHISSTLAFKLVIFSWNMFCNV